MMIPIIGFRSHQLITESMKVQRTDDSQLTCYVSVQEVARGLKELLAYEGNVEDDLCLNFHVSIEEFGKVITVNLRENGEEVAVTNENREEYVRLYLDWILNTAIYEQVRAFYLGFHTLGASNALLVSP